MNKLPFDKLAFAVLVAALILLSMRFGGTGGDSDAEVVSPENAREIFLKLGGEAERPVVIAFVTDWCPYCKALERWLSEHGVYYVRANIEKDRTAAAAFRKLTGGQSGVPRTLIGTRLVEGFAPANLSAALALSARGVEK